jgi:hypothetical protein
LGAHLAVGHHETAKRSAAGSADSAGAGLIRHSISDTSSGLRHLFHIGCGEGQSRRRGNPRNQRFNASCLYGLKPRKSLKTRISPHADAPRPGPDASRPQ